MLFFAAAGVLALGVLVLLILPLLRRTRAPEGRDAKDVALYRRQLAEVERDAERGVIRDSEAEGARAEISRRLIAAHQRAEAAAPPPRAPRELTGLVAGAALVGLPLVAALVYLAGGAPGMPDQPLAERDAAFAGLAARPGQEDAEARAGPPEAPPDTPEMQQFAEMIGRVEEIVAERPDDAQGLALLANGYLRLGRPAEAWRTYDRLIDLAGDDLPADIHAYKAEAMALAAGGYVSPEAEQALDAALGRDPRHQIARYYRGLALAQQNRFAEAVTVWEDLRAEAGTDAPWAAPLDDMIAEARRLAAGLPAPAPAPGTMPGPGAAELEAAAGMTPDERREMIDGMVAGLEERLTGEGGEPEEWYRLMASYKQLGRPDDARRAYELGVARLGPDGGAAFLREQALLLGIVEQ